MKPPDLLPPGETQHQLGRPRPPAAPPRKHKVMNGAQALVASLVASDVTVCFANPGTSEMQFVAALDGVAGDARRPLPVRGGGDRGGGRLRPHGGPARRHPAAPGPGPRPTASPTCTTPAGPARRSSTWSATTPPITSSFDPPLSRTSTPGRHGVGAGSAGQPPRRRRRRTRRSRGGGAARRRAARHLDPARGRRCGKTARRRGGARHRPCRRWPDAVVGAAAAARSAGRTVGAVPRRLGAARPALVGRAPHRGRHRRRVLTETFTPPCRARRRPRPLERIRYFAEMATAQLAGAATWCWRAPRRRSPSSPTRASPATWCPPAARST